MTKTNVHEERGKTGLERITNAVMLEWRIKMGPAKHFDTFRPPHPVRTEDEEHLDKNESLSRHPKPSRTSFLVPLSFMYLLPFSLVQKHARRSPPSYPVHKNECSVFHPRPSPAAAHAIRRSRPAAGAPQRDGIGIPRPPRAPPPPPSASRLRPPDVRRAHRGRPPIRRGEDAPDGAKNIPHRRFARRPAGARRRAATHGGCRPPPRRRCSRP